MKTVHLFWIDDMESWSASARANLEIIAKKYDVYLHIDYAINGENVTQKLMLHEFDGVIMDYQMEPNNGDKYIRDIRNEEHLEFIPIVFYSQNNSIDLNSLVSGLRGIITVFRPNLEDIIKEMFLEPRR